MTAPEPRRPRLIVVGATYTTLENRKKIRALATHFDVLCVTGDRYVGYGIENRLSNQPRPEGYRLTGLPCIGAPESTTHYRLAGLGAVLRGEPPADVVLVESEPWAQVRWQTWRAARRAQPGALFGEFSWENVRRPGLKGLVLRGFYRAAVRTADFVITGNLGAAELFRTAGLEADRLLVSPQLGVDPEVFRPVDPGKRRAWRVASGLPEGAFVVGFAGRLAPEKGVWDLVSAVEECRARTSGGQAAGMHLAVLGHGPLVEGLRARAATTPWLHVYPPCTHPEMARFMQGLDLFVLPSRELHEGGHHWKEQFGHVLIEAMGCGVATIGSNSGAIPEVLGEPATEYSAGLPRSLADRIALLEATPVERAALGERQRARVLAHYTHARLAAAWAGFLRERLTSRSAPGAGGRPFPRGRGVVLGDYCITGRGEDRPRRFLDHFHAWESGEVKPCFAFMERTDEQLQRRLRFLRSPRARRIFNYCLGPWSISRHWRSLSRAGFLYLEGPHLFWTLVLLNRLGLFPVKGKVIPCLFFRQASFEKKISLFNRTPPAFRPFFTSGQQVRDLERRGTTPGRLRFIKWQVDAEWYRPAEHPTRDFILCPGNIHRDERLVCALLEGPGLPLRLVRAGRLEGIREDYAVAARRWPGAVELAVNLDHRAYLRLVQNAALVLLPISPCDEPAGLTAALEALACSTPLLANDSLEVGTVLRESTVGDPLPDLALTTWRRAIAEVLRPDAPDPGRWRRGRSYIERERAIPPGNQDWREFVAVANL